MNLTLNLPEEVARQVERLAAARGQDVNTFIVELVKQITAEANGTGPPSTAATGVPTLDEVAAPIAKAFEESGLSDAELEEFFEGVRDEVWREKQGKPT